MRLRVAVLGCGPAGLLAAHAAELGGHEVHIYSKRVKSELGGAQYLHERIPGLELPNPITIMHQMIGDAEVYRSKVGYPSDIPVSFSDALTAGPVQAWNLRHVYNQLWERFEKNVNVVSEINNSWMYSLTDNRKYDAILSSIPLTAICHSSHHSFQYQQVMIVPQCVSDLPDNTIVYHGGEEQQWYRQSKLFGVGGTEYGSHAMMPALPTIKISKPVRNDCSCFPEVIRIGRYGEWRKGVLTHDAFFTAQFRLEDPR